METDGSGSAVLVPPFPSTSVMVLMAFQWGALNRQTSLPPLALLVVLHVVGVCLLLGQFDLERHYLPSDWVRTHFGGSIACTSQSPDYTGALTDLANNSGGHFSIQVNAAGVRVGEDYCRGRGGGDWIQGNPEPWVLPSVLILPIRSSVMRTMKDHSAHRG